MEHINMKKLSKILQEIKLKNSKGKIAIEKACMDNKFATNEI